jgi:hypothetical protein
MEVARLACSDECMKQVLPELGVVSPLVSRGQQLALLLPISFFSRSCLRRECYNQIIDPGQHRESTRLAAAPPKLNTDIW